MTNPTSIRKRVETIRGHLHNKELKKAIDQLDKLIAIESNWVYTERLSELRTHYQYMLHYFLEGQQDPERQAIYQKITRDIYTLADDAANQLLTRNCPSFFYEQTRNMNRRIAVTLDTYAETFEKQTDTFSFIGLLEEGEEKGDRLKQIQMSYENTVREMFYTVYTSSSTKGMNGLVDSMKRFMENQLVPVQAKGMFLTALTLNILHRFTRERSTCSSTPVAT